LEPEEQEELEELQVQVFQEYKDQVQYFQL